MTRTVSGNMKEFDANNCKLQGVNVIEASAGTGKTYNIQLLVLRLLLEEKIPLQKILVVTFTVLATEELKERLHGIILLTAKAFEECSQNPSELEKEEYAQIRQVVKKEFVNGSDLKKQECKELINAALRDFSQASVMTIHGFCQRMLQDHAFASNINLGVELKENIEEIRFRIAMDFIRLIRYSNEPAEGFPDTKLLCTAVPETVTAQFLLDRLDLAIDSLDNNTHIEWEQHFSDLTWQEQLYSLPRLAGSAGDDKDKIFDSLGSCFLKFYREQLNKYKTGENFVIFNDLIKLMADTLADRQSGPALRQAIRESFSYAFVDEFQDTDPLQYQIFSNVFGNGADDSGFFMIGDPKQAIYAFRGGDIFAYRKAVDRVPDNNRFTLSKNFRSSEKYIRTLNKFFSNFPLDNFTEIKFGGSERYCLCKDNVPVENLLQINYLQTSEIGNDTIHKVMELLSGKYSLQIPGENVSKPVTASDIAILFPSKSKGAELEKLLNQKGIDTIWMSDSNIFRKKEAKSLCNLLKMLYDGCTFSHILSVLSDGIFQCLAPELTRLQESGNIDQNEAGEDYAAAAQNYFLELRKVWDKRGFYAMFEKLMFAPNNEGRAWLTAIRENILGRFEEDQSLAQHLIHVDFVEGRYVLGRLRQLGDILHQVECDRQFTPGRLLNYLLRKIQDDKIDDPNSDPDVLVQRSTDTAAVRMLTLHASKGLQFPIVLIPYFITARNKKSPRLYHNAQGSRFLDMAKWYSPEKKRSKEKEQACKSELLEEKKRLLYVGVTRAKYYCYLSGSGSSRGVYTELRKNLPAMPADPEDDDIPERISQVIDYNYEESAVRTFDGKPSRDWTLASFSGFVRSFHGAGMAKKSDKPEQFYGGTDEVLTEEETQSSESSNLPVSTVQELPGDEDQELIFRFGSGAEMGTVWHEVFETMNFKPDVSNEAVFNESECDELLAAVDNPVLYYGLRRYKEEDEESRKRDRAFARMLKGVLFNPMGEMSKADGERFQLSDIPVSQRASELKFMFVLKENVTLKQIKACLEKYNIPTGTWADSAEAVYQDHALIGFIDLLFRSSGGKYYILDWKSNRLEGVISSFNQEGMQSEIDRNLYSLQFLIYTVALWHFLKERRNLELTEENYSKYFGGILYLFIRGIAAPLANMSEKEKEVCRTRGIYYSYPPCELIMELKQLLEIRQMVPGGSGNPEKTE